MQLHIIIIIRDLKSVSETVYAALYNRKGRQYCYNTIKYKRVKIALLKGAYNLRGVLLYIMCGGVSKTDITLVILMQVGGHQRHDR